MNLQSQTKLVVTEDGSHSLYLPSLDEHYHSIYGAIQESRHVYIQAGLNVCEWQNINVLEIGFGTGLNAYLTLREAERTFKSIYYTSLELYPLDIEKIKKLNYHELLAQANEDPLFLTLHKVGWGSDYEITSRFTLHKINIDFSNPKHFRTDIGFDVIFFDAFAPEKQPEMWTQEVFDKLYCVCNKDAIITTYCAKGTVRRMLQAAGFVVERLPGPPGKREILRGRKF